MLTEFEMLIDWYSKDEKIKANIDRINNSGMQVQDQVIFYYHEISEAYSIPKGPEDFTEEHYDHYDEMDIDAPHSVFEEFSLLNYLHPRQDLANLMLLALYNTIHGSFTPIELVAEKHYGSLDKIPSVYTICFVGNELPGQLHFLENDEGWYDTGARSARRIG